MKYLISRDSKRKLRVVEISCEWEEDAYKIRRVTYQYGGKKTVQPVIIVDSGKGIGKARTTVTEQAEIEFNSHVRKYLDKGYKELQYPINEYTKEQLEAILPDEVTDSNGNLKPMLALDYHKVAASILEKHWWYGSRKLDGCRCIMFVKDGEIHTSSRGGKDYDNSTYHITCNKKFKKYMLAHPELILDGELYFHGEPLQTLSGWARLKKDTDKCDKLQYYIYDIVDTNKTFEERLEIIEDLAEELELGFDPNKEFVKNELQIQIVPHEKVNGWSEIKRLHDNYVGEGFEGLVIRDPEAKYGINARNKSMIKIKEYMEDEFEIVDYNDGLRPEDMVFICQTKEGKLFEAKPVGPRELKYQYLNDMDKIIGKMVTIKFFTYSKDSIPTQPVAKCIRDYE